MILRRKSKRQLCKKTGSDTSCPAKKNKPNVHSSGRKCKTHEMKQRKLSLANQVSFQISSNLITSTPIKKSLISDDDLKISNQASTTKKKSSSRNVSSSVQEFVTPKSGLESGTRVTRLRSSLSCNSICKSSRSEKLYNGEVSANNLQTSEITSKPCQVINKKISFNSCDSCVNESIKDPRKSTVKRSLRKKPALHLASTPISANSEKKSESKTRTKAKKADKKDSEKLLSLNSKQSSDFSFTNSMMLRSGNSFKKASTVASCIEPSSIITSQDHTAYNNQNVLSSKRCKRKVTKSQGQRSSKRKQYKASQCQTPLIKIDKNKRKSKIIYEYSSSFVKQHENCLSFCGEIPVDDLFSTSKHYAQNIECDDIKVDDLCSQIPVDDLCLISKRYPHKTQSQIEIPKYGLMSKRNTRKVQSETKCKRPYKSTLKRKRAVIEAIKKAEESYEDDIYEGKKFDQFKYLSTDSPELDASFSIPTPKFGFQVTPVFRQKTPKITDCFNPKTFALSRKIAEECMYRRNKKRKIPSSLTKSVTPSNSRRKKKTFKQVMSEVAKVQDKIEKEITNESEDDYDDSFFFSDS